MGSRNVVIVGAGAVGATYAYALAQSGLADKISIIDSNNDLAKGQVLDLAHGKPFYSSVSITDGDAEDYKNAQLIVIAAGVAQEPGETRLDLLKRNAVIVKNICDEINKQHSQAIILVVTNPVDVMAQVAIKYSNAAHGRVFGSGTVLDSARFRNLLSEFAGVDVHNVHGYILGEHGDSEFAAWSLSHVAGIPVDDFCSRITSHGDWQRKRDEIEKEVRDSAYHVIGYKGATCYAIGMALVRMTKAILRGENQLLTVSTFLNGEYGLSGVCLSVPSVVSSGGVEKIIDCNLKDNEMMALEQSAKTIIDAARNSGL